MSIVSAIFQRLLARQVAQHGSMAAVVLGLVFNLLGIPLAGEQISLLITAFSVVVYVASQVRALWHPKVAAALIVLGLGVPSHYARAADAPAVVFLWDAVTLGDDDSILPATDAVFEYGIACEHSLADLQAHEGNASAYLYTELVQASKLTVSHVFALGDYVCGLYAHNPDGWSVMSNAVSFTVAAPVVHRKPRSPRNFKKQ